MIVVSVLAVQADRPVNATPETQAISVSTQANVLGITTADESLAWKITNIGSLDTMPLSMPYPAHVLQTGDPFYTPIDKIGEQDGDIIFIDWLSPDFTWLPSYWTDGQEQYTTAYNEKTTAISGQTTYLKNSAVSTANKVQTQNNYQTAKQVIFEGGDGGNLVSSEDLLLDGAGSFSPLANSILCPFAQTAPPTIWPEFCNIIEMGSSVEMTSVSLSTQAGDRFISATGDVPVAATYHINVEGVSSAPASGSVQAFVKSHIQEGRMNYVTSEVMFETDPIYVYRPGKAGDLTQSETSSASGSITRFDKVIQYQSGIKPL